MRQCQLPSTDARAPAGAIPSAAPACAAQLDDPPAVLGGTPVRDEFLVFGRPDIRQEEIDEVVDTLRSGWIGTGPKVVRLEDAFRRYTGAGHAMAVSSCTAGLHLALDAVGVGPGDEVITSPLTFGATGNVIVQAGARPVFADIDPLRQTIDPVDIERRITPRTKAIVPVHMAGRPCDMNAISELATAHGLAVIGDAAHAIETRYRGEFVTVQADISVLSFYATKNITTCEGGMVLTNHEEWAHTVDLKRSHGLSRDAWKRYSGRGFLPYEVIEPGYKYNMTDLQASLGLHQLARIDANWRVRRRHWDHYMTELSDCSELILPPEEVEPGNRHALHLFTVSLGLEDLTAGRHEFVAALTAEGIGTGVHYTALHLHRWYQQTLGYRVGDLPRAEWLGERTISLPMGPRLSDDDIDDVVRAVQRLVRAFRRQRW